MKVGVHAHPLSHIYITNKVVVYTPAESDPLFLLYPYV